jgi:hypothetical protein
VRSCGLLTIMALLVVPGFSAAAPPQELNEVAAPRSHRPEPSLALSPAVIMITTSPGGSSTHTLTITNLTYAKCRFVMEAFDVVVHDGQRVFVPAGETSRGIARSAIFDPPALEVSPGQSAQVKITLTVPPEPAVRAVAAIFHAESPVPGNGNPTVTASLGTLITYSLSDKFALDVGAPTVNPQTKSSDLTFSEPLENDGAEPIVAKGTLAILTSSGELIGRIPIESHRLLPGEKFKSVVEYPRMILRGGYRALISFVHDGEVQTSSIQFQVQ